MLASKSSIEQDVSELQQLLQGNTIQSSRIRNVLTEYMKKCEFQLTQFATSNDTTTTTTSQPEEEKLSTSSLKKPVVVAEGSFVSIGKFGWEDEGYGKDKVQIYIMSGIDGVGELPKDLVTCDFTSESFDLKIMGFQGKDYRLRQNFLEKEIVANKCTFKVKKNRVTISLWKKDNKQTWTSLALKKPRTEKEGKSGDPSADIMGMMKEMYDSGDADMKRTIAKAWTESREKKSQDFGMDM